MNIRPAQPEDVFKIHDMHMASIRENCSEHYTEKEISAWSGRTCNEEARCYQRVYAGR